MTELHQPELPQGEKPKKSRKLTIILSVVISVVVLLAIAYYFVMRDLLNTTDEWWNEIRGGDGGDTPANVDRF